jgi:hypothetical protein
MSKSVGNRPLTEQERMLARYMLEHGTSEPRSFIEQLDRAEVTPWRCPCGCASINFQLRGQTLAPPGVHILGDFVFDSEGEHSGAFIYSCEGVLSGLEVFGGCAAFLAGPLVAKAASERRLAILR